MRTPAAIADGGWIRRLVVRCGATTVALLGHIAILLALAYDPTHDPSLLEPVAAIAVEIVFVPPANAAAALTPPVVTLDQADTSVTELVHTDRDSKRLREMNDGAGTDLETGTNRRGCIAAEAGSAQDGPPCGPPRLPSAVMCRSLWRKSRRRPALQMDLPGDQAG